MQDSILLRWAPADYTTWEMGNKYGYNVVRYTILKDSTLVSPPQKTILTPNALKPFELNDWENLVKTDKYAGIAAQAIYGETFEIATSEQINPQNVTWKSKEQQQRYSFALYSADMSSNVAKASALWFSDKTAKQNENYLYRVFITVPDSVTFKSDTAFIYTGISENTELPVPLEFSAEPGDKTILLSWNSFAQNNIYIAWQIERSENGGKQFASISSDPIVPLTSESVNPEYSHKMDSLSKNGKEYLYRIRGINSFGEYGPWSPNLTGTGIEALKSAPNITGHTIVKSNVELTWEFEKEDESGISGFRILRSGNHKGSYLVLKENVKASVRSFTDKNPLSTAYYKVVAYKDKQAAKESHAYLVQFEDNTPPAKPSGLVGSADSNLIITLSWKSNTDEDILGYRVFRSASNNDEYAQKTHAPIPDTFFVDTISKKDLNSSVFYKIAAIDKRQNQSEFSKVLEVIKLDRIPPSFPVITETTTESEGITIKWINSTSADVKAHIVYRIQKGDTAWTKLAEQPYKRNTQTSEFIDSECSSSKSNQYKVVAVDKAGNISRPAVSIVLKGIKSKYAIGIQKIKKLVDYENGSLQLNWELPEKEIKYIKIYRKPGTSPYSLYKTLEGDATQFNDNGFKVGDKIAYRIKIIYFDGSISAFSDEQIVNY